MGRSTLRASVSLRFQLPRVRLVGLQLFRLGVLVVIAWVVRMHAIRVRIEGDAPIIEWLARARQDFSVSCFLAWRDVTQFRKNVDGLQPWEAPAEDLRLGTGNTAPDLAMG